MKFKFVEHHFIKSGKPKKEEVLEETLKKVGAFFGSEENLIDTLLNSVSTKTPVFELNIY